MIDTKRNRLELGLRAWENVCWSRWAAWQYEEAAGQEHTLDFGGGVEKFRRIRSDMMQIRPFANVDDLADSYELPPMVRLEFPILSRLPRYLFRWTSQSRRIYDVSREATATMMVSKFTTMRWRDVQWPFKSFAMRFAKPVHEEDGYDFFLVNITDGSLEVLLLSNQLESYDFLPPVKQQRIERLFRQGRIAAVGDKINALARIRRPMPPIAGTSVLIEDPDQLVSEALENTFRKSLEYTDRLRRNTRTLLEGKNIPEHIRRLAGRVTTNVSYDDRVARERSEVNVHLPIALSVYLAALAYGRSNLIVSEKGKEVKDKKSAQRGRSISDPDFVCEVQSTIQFSGSELEAIEACRTQAMREVSTHFRQFHMRRPPGKGHIETEPKTVPVRATIVNEAKTSQGELPGGATTKL